MTNKKERAGRANESKQGEHTSKGTNERNRRSCKSDTEREVEGVEKE